MKKLDIYLFVALVLIIVSMGTSLKIAVDKLKYEKAEKEIYINNTQTLMADIRSYHTKDSLHVVSVVGLKLKLLEYEKYRVDNLKLINSLKVDKKRLERITTAQTHTIYELKGIVKDSIVIRDNHIIDTLQCVRIRSIWFDMEGCMGGNNEFEGRFENRDSLAIVNHVKQKRFLGFLWYFGNKESRVDVVSRNPNTQIQGVEYIEIRD